MQPLDAKSTAPPVESIRIAEASADGDAAFGCGRLRRYTRMSASSCEESSGQRKPRLANSAFMVEAWFHISFTSAMGSLEGSLVLVSAWQSAQCLEAKA